MPSEALVDLSYRGLVLGKRVRLLQVGPRSAYVAHDAPMPVGTELVLTVDESLAIRAEVARVREGDSKDGPAGMWLWADAAEQRARVWWDAHVSADDPRIPEPEGGRVRTEAPVVTVPEPAPAPAAASPDREAAESSGHAVETAAASVSEPQPDQGPQDAGVEAGAAADAGDTSQAIATASLLAAGDVEGARGGEQLEEGAGEQLEEGGGEQLEEGGGEQLEEGEGEQLEEGAGEDDDYAVEIRRAATNAEREHARAATSDPVEEPLELPRSHGRQPRGTQVMTAVEIADVLGMPPVLDGDGLLEAAGAEGGEREIRTTHVMSAIEVEEVLASGGAEAPSEPEVRDGGSAGGKGRKRRGRKRR
jgi:hypothetical protein